MTLIDKAAEMFAVPATTERVASILWHLGLRETCTRCGGSGSYSYNQRDGTRCYGCNGRRERAAKLTKRILDAARAKVEAGELVALRERWAALAAAKRQIAPRVARAREVYLVISDAYTAAYRQSWEIPRALFAAQGMNNSIFWGDDTAHASVGSVKDVEDAVREGRLDALTALARIDVCIELLEQLRDAWLARPMQGAEA